MMTSRIFGSPAGRPLFIDFNAYTDGDDEFKKELIDLMIENLQELQQTSKLAAQNNDGPLFHRVCHKIKATTEMLSDAEFSETIEQLKVIVTDASRIAHLDKICGGIIDSLRKAS